MLKNIKWFLQRGFRGYDDRIKTDFSIHVITILPALRQFCLDKLSNKKLMGHNPRLESIYTRTVELIDTYNHKQMNGGIWSNDKIASEMFAYIGQNLGSYWD